MRIRSGIEGFDTLIEGGFPHGRQYLLSGTPGSGKSTFGIQFLAAGAHEGETGAYVALSESIGTLIEDMSRYNLHMHNFMDKTRKYGPGLTNY